MDLTPKIQQLAEGLLKNNSFFIVEVVISMKRKPGKILVVLDGDTGVTIEDCAALSRELSGALDNTELAVENYSLEITTPGLDQPLRLKRQYKKNIGRILNVKLTGETKSEEGKLISASETEIILERKSGKGKNEKSKSITIPFSAIDKTFVTISFK